MAGMAGTKQHWLPAAVLGGFSVETQRPSLRNRRLHVLRRGHAEPFVAAPTKLAYRVGLYDMSGEHFASGLPGGSLDATWAAYERRLPNAFHEVHRSERYLSFEVWMKALVPYIAGLTVRAPSYGEAIQGAMIQFSRWVEQTRMLALLMCCDWVHLVAPPDTPFIINDRGFSWAVVSEQRVGIVVPVLPTSALLILPRGGKRKVIGAQEGGQWVTHLPRWEWDAWRVEATNDDLARDALYWVAGGRAEDVASRIFGEPYPTRFALGGPGWPSIRGMGAHTMDWANALHAAGIPWSKGDWHPFWIVGGGPSGISINEEGGRTFIEVQIADDELDR